MSEQQTISAAEARRVKLTGYLSAICLLISVIYAGLDAAYNIYYSFPAYLVLFSLPAISLLLLRKRSYRMAKVLLILSVDLVVFWSAIHDPFETGVFLFFITLGIGAFVIFDTADAKIAAMLLGFTTVVFLISHFFEFDFVKVNELSPSYVQISFLFNFFISLAVSVSAIYFLMSLNRLAENQLIQKEIQTRQKNLELQKVNAELDSFVYRVSHDLRSPLTSILGLTNIAKYTTDRRELEEIHHMIEGRIEAQDVFIREIIDYSRNARTTMIPEVVNVEGLVSHILEDMRYMENAAKIQFSITIPEDLTLRTDKVRLRMILSNLISNGIKYCDTSKRSVIEIGYENHSGKLYVADNGIGIGPEILAKIFDMFYRGSERSTGSGLGLFIAREAADKLGGFIEVESVSGAGTTFKVYIPEVPPQNQV